MGEQVLLKITCDEATGRAQKIQACTRVQKEVSRIKGIKETHFTGSEYVDIVAFAECEESSISVLVGEIKRMQGVTDVQARILITV